MEPAWDEIVESNEQFLGAWKHFAEGAADGLVARFDGLAAMYSRVPVMFLNAIGFTSYVQSPADLRARIINGQRYAAAAGFPYFFSICKELMSPEAREDMDDAFAAAGLFPFFNWTGMAAEEILPPRRSVTDLDIRDVTDSPARRAVYEINCHAYDMPLDPGRDSMDLDSFWANMHGAVGYVDNRPVATATAFRVDGRRYVALVATMPDYRNRGYAEACMRHALQRAGAGRTVLHATEAGHPIYLKMGYRDVCHFRMYGESHE
ncbi:MAG: GNAT family N-acetyltransferase [Acidobacteria bacterium]|nr:GNAT family N-acetyltransferase [Acidobacteriota bacterium]